MITATEIKTLLQITGATYDSIIDSLLPIVMDDLLHITNNDFAYNEFDYAISDDFTFDATTGITCANADDLKFLDVGAGDDIIISDSLRNNGFFPVASKSDTIITTSTPFAFVAEVQPANHVQEIMIQKVLFPKALKIPISKMVGFHLDKNAQLGKGVQSESLGRYSVSYNMGGYSYPPLVIEGLRPFMMIGVK